MTRYVKGVSVYKPKARSRRTDPYLMAFTEAGKRCTLAGSTDLQVTIMKANQISLRLQSAKLGLVDRNVNRFAKFQLRRLTDQIEDYRKVLLAEDNTEGYAQETTRLITRVLAAAKMEYVDDVSESGLQIAIGNLAPTRAVKNQKLSLRTRDKAVRAVKSFFHWMKRDKRVPSHLAVDIEHYDPEQDRRRVRRVISEELILTLIETTAPRKFLGGMTGKARSIMYATAIGTGFRFGTLKHLRPCDFDFASTPVIVIVEANSNKGRKRIEHPLREDLAALLATWMKGKPADAPLFTPSARFNETFQKDCRAARIPEIDDSGHVFDFHAQRNQYITAIVRAAGLAVAQDLAHHSTPVLTKRYARLSFDDYDAALAGLPAVERKERKGNLKIG